MLKFHNVNGLEGKVSMNLIDMYKLDYKNLLLSSIIAGFHRSYGLRNEGIAMSLEIVNNIMDDTDNIQDRCLLVWNLYSLIDEFVEEEDYEKAMELACRAERNWSRDIVLGDEMGVYHVSWIEQIWQKQAEIYHLIGDRNHFSILTDKIMSSRLCLFMNAAGITGESISRDRCAYACLQLMAFDARRYDIDKAISYMRMATDIKSGCSVISGFAEKADRCGKQMQCDQQQSIENGVNIQKMDSYAEFSKCVKSFFSFCEQSFDNISYTYCKSCANFQKGSKCAEMNLIPKEFHCCSRYMNKIQM